jgi:iron complex outermembrane receptor protein
VLSGLNLLGRWNKRLDDGASLQVQTYFDNAERNDPFTYSDRVDQFDVEVQHAFRLTSNQKIIWGGGYRHGRQDTNTHYDSPSPLPQAFVPARLSLAWGNLFVQDEIALNANLNLTLGIKAEYNIFTHMEYLPNARLAWRAGNDATLWAAASRAVRAPAVIDRDFYLYLVQAHGPLFPVISGGPGFQSEVAHVYEIGYRTSPAAGITFSVTGFYSLYDKLRSGEPPPNAMVQNLMYGTTDGIEAWGSWQIAPRWRLSAGLLGMHEDLKIRPGSTDPTGPSALGNDPKLQWQVRSSHTISDTLEFDVAARHVGQLPNPVVPAYTAVDMRLGWRINRNADLSLSGQNLFDRHHVEFTGNLLSSASLVERAVFLKLQLRN